ncbi:MAG TPA: transketolase [Lentisphaeria bacterium]|nr:MAG: transketolase [Lentisphaerae bacterium GWF2_50_93]HCE45305.1 transketolase [Lentisphaeria bacterium]
MTDYRLEKLAADTIRVLSAEAVQKAKSGHPGMPMGCADYGFMLWYKYMKHNPKNPQWLARDRFVLSAGHGSMLLYSLLHMFEYGLSMDELKSFRQWDSKTPGHPEFKHTAGVEVTTGPLGSGFASGVGMAMAAKNFAARTGLDKTELMNHKIYILCSDGCMMEGTTHETAPLAGHLRLDNIIAFYDDNSITIEGATSLAFSENVSMRYEAYGWRVIQLKNANDLEQVDKALAEAQKSDGRPTLIVGKTTIGFGSPGKAGKHSCHGEPLGDDEVAAVKVKLGFEKNPPFTIPQEVKDCLAKRCRELASEAAKWDREFQSYLEKNQESAKMVSSLLHKPLPENLLEELIKAAPVDKPVATRVSGGTVLNRAADLIPALMGGAADLTPSTKTNIKNTTSFTATDRSGRNFHFGVRELGMAMLSNGMALYGTCIPYSATFFVFSDYMKPAIRLASIQGLHEVYVFTHDSFYVGEDGPTHEPIEQTAMLRTIPGMTVIRPAEANETAHAWYAALKSKGPVALLLTRQDLDPIPPELTKKIDVSKGAYVLSEDAGYEMIIMATGSEVNLALKSADMLRKEGRKVRVVSMPCLEYFQAQDKSYRDSVLPPSCRRRVTIEAGTTFGWRTYAGDEGLCIGLDHFGASAPFKVLADKFGFTPEKVVEKIKSHF